MKTLLLSTLALLAPQDDPVEAWSEAAVTFIQQLEQLHPDPWFGCPREELEAALDEFIASIEDASEERRIVEFMRLVAMFGREGRDGHSMAWPWPPEVLPVRLYGFADGWFVVDADGPARDWIGARLVALGDVPVDEACERIAPLLTGDNSWNLRGKLGRALVATQLLAGTGIAADASGCTLTLERDGERHEVPLHASRGPMSWWGALPDRPGVLWLEGRDVAWRTQVLEDERALYVQYNEVTDEARDGTRIDDLAAEIVRTFDERNLEKVIVDVRSNGGGNNGTFPPLIAALKDEAIDRPGVLFCLIGRETFSAAGNFVTTIEKETKAILVGEPTGGAPNQYGDARTIELPDGIPVLLRVSTRYHQFSSADDPRLTHEPHLAVPLRSTDYFAGRDPVLEAVLNYTPPK